MYTKTVFETPQEFLNACSKTRMENDPTPSIPPSVFLVFDGDNIKLSGEYSERFMISDRLTQADLITAVFQQAGIKIHIT